MSPSPKDKRKSITWKIGIFAMIIALWGANLALGLHGELGDKTGRGTFGDMFGAINSLFTGLALAALAISIWLQKEDVANTREELDETKRIFSEQQKLTEAQQEAVQRQIFEGLFFQTLRMLTETVNNITVKGMDRIDYGGKDAFKIFAVKLRGQDRAGWTFRNLGQERRLQRYFENTPTENRPIRPSDESDYNPQDWEDYEARQKEWDRMVSAKDRVQKSTITPHEIWQEFIQAYSNDLNHYFRLLCNNLRLIENFAPTNEFLYSNIIRDQLSDDELIIIYLHGLSEREENFKPLVEKYGLLKHVNRDEILIKECTAKYAPSAFQ